MGEKCHKQHALCIPRNGAGSCKFPSVLRPTVLAFILTERVRGQRRRSQVRSSRRQHISEEKLCSLPALRDGLTPAGSLVSIPRSWLRRNSCSITPRGSTPSR